MQRCIKAIELNKVASDLESEAAYLRRRAAQEQEAFEREKTNRDKRHIVNQYSELLDKGMSHHQAVGWLATERLLPRESVEYYIQASKPAMRSYERWKRDRLIIEMARTKTNQELADHFGLSKGRISQIIGKAFNRTKLHKKR